jgi:hypothetical protein
MKKIDSLAALNERRDQRQAARKRAMTAAQAEHSYQRRAAIMHATTARLTRQVEQRKLGSKERLAQHLASLAAFEATVGRAQRIAAQEQQKLLVAQQEAIKALDRLMGRQAFNPTGLATALSDSSDSTHERA